MSSIPIARPSIGEEEIRAVEAVLRSGMLVQGEAVARFEDEFSAYIGSGAGVAVSNGTVALDLALKGLSLEPGSEVITPAFTFIATANVALYQGLRPRFADVDPRTFNIDPEDLAERITPRTKAVIGVHLYGQPFDLDAVSEICEDRGLHLIEDCAQAHGAELNGKKVGSYATGCFSFYPTKNMTTGEGGMITTDDPELGIRLRLLRNHGDLGKYNHVVLGYNYRMTNIQGALGLVQLKRLEKFIRQREKNAQALDQGLKVEGITTPYKAPGARHVYNQYVVRVEEEFPFGREELMARLQKAGIATAVHYPKPVYEQPLYRELGLDRGVSCPVAEEVSARVMSLPVYPDLGSDDLSRIIQTMNEMEA